MTRRSLTQAIRRQLLGDHPAPTIKRRRFSLLAVLALIIAPVSAYAWSDNQAAGSRAAQSLTPQLPAQASADTATTAAGNASQQGANVSVNVNHTQSIQTPASSGSAAPHAQAEHQTGNSQASVTINGKTMNLPASGGTIHKSYSDANGSTSVDVSVDNTGNSTSNASVNVQVDASSTGSNDTSLQDTMP